MHLLRVLWAWIRSWFRRYGPNRPLRTVHVEELPAALDLTSVYVLGEGEYRWFVAMACPCGCGATVQISLLNDAKPRWNLSEHEDGTISVSPSVWRKEGCCSHFFVRRGLIHWCHDRYSANV